MAKRALYDSAATLVALLLLAASYTEGLPQFWFNYPISDWSPAKTRADSPTHPVRPYFGFLPPRITDSKSHGPNPGNVQLASPTLNQQAAENSKGSDGPQPNGASTLHVSKILTIDEREQPSSINPEFVFPDQTSAHSQALPKLLPRVGSAAPECARGTTFCEDDANYPANEIEDILRNAVDDFQGLFGEDHLPINVSQRIDAFDEIAACRSREEIIFPTMAENENKHWLYVVNIKDKYEQGVRVELCTKEGTECAMKAVPFGYVSSCKQKYIYRKLVSIGENGKAESNDFKLPSCCACYFKPESPNISFGKSISRKRRDPPASD